jgi:hypothetical protein
MISFTLFVNNPLSKESFANLFSKSGALYGNKFWEFEILKLGGMLLDLTLAFHPRGRDHGGLKLEVGLLGFELSLNIYDSRHWDEDANKWEDTKVAPL